MQCLNAYCVVNSLKAVLENCGPLSVISMSGIPW